MSIDDIYRDINTFIEANYASNATMKDFAVARGIPQSSAQEALSYYAKSWGRLMLDERMKRAKELLSYSGESIDDIAVRMGYTPMQFVQVFKAEEGKEPEEYRQWIQNQQRGASPRNGSPSS